MWEIEYTDEFGEWWEQLSESEQDALVASIGLLEELGPNLGRPHADHIKASKHTNMKRIATVNGRNKFSKLKGRLGADRLEQVEAKTKTMLAEMLLPEIRKHSGMTQKEVASVLGISQPGLSKIEHQDDMQIGTLSKLIEAMGGTLEIIAHLPQGDCRLTQFGD